MPRAGLCVLERLCVYKNKAARRRPCREIDLNLGLEHVWKWRAEASQVGLDLRASRRDAAVSEKSPYLLMFSASAPLRLCVILFLFCLSASALQPHRAWVQHFDEGLPDKAHEAVTMALDSKGNILVTGSVQNCSNLLVSIPLTVEQA